MRLGGHLRRGALGAVFLTGLLSVAVPAGAAPHATSTTSMATMSMSTATMDAKMKAASHAATLAAPKSGTTITIHNFAFAPGSIKVKPGQVVRVTNKDTVVHTVSAKNGMFTTGDIAPGKTVTFKAPMKAGRYSYRCDIHQYMTGVLVVS